MFAPIVLAHGIGGRSDLPISVTMAQYGAVAVLLLTVALLGSGWRTPRFSNGSASRKTNDDIGPSRDMSRSTTVGIPLPILQRVIDGRVSQGLFTSLGVVALIAFLTVATFGANDSTRNPAPTWLYVWLWVGLVPASVLFGPVIRRLNPYRPLAALGRRFLATVGYHHRDYPDMLGRWPAVAWFGVFTWMELVLPDRDAPSRVLMFVVLYSVVQLAGAIAFGPTWHRNADAFEVYSDLVGHLSPFRRDPRGTLVLANPLRHLSALPIRPGDSAVVYVLLGSTAFDGITRTRTWNDWTRSMEGTTLDLLGTAGLIASIAVVALTFRFACSLTRLSMNDRSGQTTNGVERAYIHTLVPIVVGYTVAHYLSLFVFQGQAGYLLATDPLAHGWNVFGFSDTAIDYAVISTSTIAWIQVSSIVIGHLVGVVTAHDRSLDVLNERERRSGQHPIVACMVLYTFCGIGLLFGA